MHGRVSGPHSREFMMPANPWLSRPIQTILLVTGVVPVLI